MNAFIRSHFRPIITESLYLPKTVRKPFSISLFAGFDEESFLEFEAEIPWNHRVKAQEADKTQQTYFEFEAKSPVRFKRGMVSTYSDKREKNGHLPTFRVSKSINSTYFCSLEKHRFLLCLHFAASKSIYCFPEVEDK